ncbi:MAG: ATP-binding protein [Gaiellaceae bacterium]
MTAVAERLELTYVELEQEWLSGEIAHARALLLAYRDGEAPPRRDPGEPPAIEPAADRLARLLGLSPFERQLLLLCAAVELDGEVALLAAELLGAADPRPTFGLALTALPDPHWSALSLRSPLRRWRLLELGPGPTLASRRLQLDERVLQQLTGMPSPDPRLDGLLRTAFGSPSLTPSQRQLGEELARTAAGTGAPVVVRLEGDDAEARLGVAQQLAAQLERLTLLVRAEALPPPGPELAELARLVDREALLLNGLPVVDAERGSEPAVAALLDLLESPLVVLVGEHDERIPGRVELRRSVALPSPAEQRALWRRSLGADLSKTLEAEVEQAAQHYRLGAAAVDAVVRELSSSADGVDLPVTFRRLCRERARVRLDGLAERIEPTANWDELVLPAGQTELLREVARHVRHRTQVYERWGFGERSARGLGVTALFTGESGTGKTMAAEVLAADLELDLYRIDLSATVSKYIGETEKNLRRLFDAAEAGGAVLLFDEADALFGKRGEVRDGHDRYANLEVAYLLQRMESYRGLAILTSNLRSNLDRAFLRRLRFVVQFPFPDAGQRAEIWRRVFPAATPLEGVDPDRLARLTLPGGSIRAIALSAAFGAAEQGTPVTPAHVLRAAQVEYAKSERPLTAAETAGLT